MLFFLLKQQSTAKAAADQQQEACLGGGRLALMASGAATEEAGSCQEWLRLMQLLRPRQRGPSAKAYCPTLQVDDIFDDGTKPLGKANFPKFDVEPREKRRPLACATRMVSSAKADEIHKIVEPRFPMRELFPTLPNRLCHVPTICINYYYIIML